MAAQRSTRAKAAPAAAAAAGSEASPAPSDPPIEPQSRPGPGLQFSHDLTWRAGRQIAVGELIKRLQTLANELRDMEQQEDEGVKQSFTKVAKELSSDQLLSHKDRGVRAWVASCSVDVLRLCAPDAPFSERELKAVFDMILKSILPALSDPANPYNSQHMYVLQSLAHVKSIVLVTDLPNADTLLLQLFESFFDILSGSANSSTGEQLAKQVVFNMTTVLVVLVEELQALPQDVVDTIMAQFLRVDSRVVAASGGKSKKAAVIEDGQSTLELKELPPAYTMAKTICNSCADKMALEVSKYFGEVIMEVTSRQRENRRESGDVEAAIEDATIAPSEEDMQELAKAHRLMRELWRACPTVLQNVIPQLEAELGAESVRLRLLATETLGDMIAGIGAAGPPAPPNMDPAMYPPLQLASESSSSSVVNLLTVPAAPQSFAQTYSEAYQGFLNRENDKSPLIRAARATGVGRILATSAGGVGLSANEDKQLAEALSRALNDSDERVRLAAIRVITSFHFRDIVSKLGSTGSVDHERSVLSNLAERVKDRKPIVREEAMSMLAKIWAAATGEISNGNEQVIDLISGASSKILNAFYTNDQDIMVLIDHTLFEVLVPLKYPPIKNKASKASSSQRVKDGQAVIEVEGETRMVEPDKIRTERILLLANGLDERAKRVFFSFSNRQVTMRKYILAYLQQCEQFNGGVVGKDEAGVKNRLAQIIDGISKLLPNPADAAKELQSFAKAHDRRSYQLLRFAMAPESDYRTVYNAIKEFGRRAESSKLSHQFMDTITPLIYRSSILLYNKSHVPYFLNYSRTNEQGLANIAYEILTEISQRSPEVLKANVSEICHQLQEDAPTATKANGVGAVDSLKACAAFARKFKEEIPQDAKFVRAMTNFALYGSPPEAAKHAITIIMAASRKKEMLARDLVQQCVKGFEYGKAGFLARLATLSRLCLEAPSEIEDHFDAIRDIALEGILLKTRRPSKAPQESYDWAVEADEECIAKCWAIRILVNRIRASQDPATLPEHAAPVYSLLIKLVENQGELSDSGNTPASHKPRLRLLAARSILKLSLSSAHNNLLEPAGFQQLALVAQDPQFEVRVGLMQRLKKYLNQNRLPARFYTVPFLLAFEPEAAFRNETTTWIRSRVAFFAQQKHAAAEGAKDPKEKSAAKVSTTLESVLPRFIHLLAHHPDYEDDNDLKDFSRYLVFYVNAVATANNVSLMYHVAQRVKTYADALQPKPGASPGKGTPRKKVAIDKTDYTERLYALSDLATLTIRAFVDAHSWSLQTLPVRLTLPRSLFVELKDHNKSVDIASHNYLPDAESMAEAVEKLARAAARKVQHAANATGATAKKRKAEAAHGDGSSTTKRARSSFNGGTSGGFVKKDATSKKPGRRRTQEWDDEDDEDVEMGANGNRGAAAAASKATRRTSGRAARSRGAYKERADSEDDEEMNVLDDEAQDGDDAMPDADDSSDHPDAHVPASPPASLPRKSTPKEAAAAVASKLASPFRKAKEKAPPKGQAPAKALPERKAPGRATRTRG